MKVLQALVGYLAVTALHFYPDLFAFAYPPAAIYYDGYFNATQKHIDGALMKDVLGSIVKTCQTVTMQNYGDSAIMKRVPGDIIETRQDEILAVPLIAFVSVIVIYVLVSIIWIAEDTTKREKFTQGTISKIISQYPKYNWVICHSPYSVGFDGVEGTDWGYTHHELDISFDRTVGYDLYWARSGTFYRHGDGGFINWAYNGNILGTIDGGATVHFGIIS